MSTIQKSDLHPTLVPNIKIGVEFESHSSFKSVLYSATRWYKNLLLKFENIKIILLKHIHKLINLW